MSTSFRTTIGLLCVSVKLVSNVNLVCKLHRMNDASPRNVDSIIHEFLINWCLKLPVNWKAIFRWHSLKTFKSHGNLFIFFDEDKLMTKNDVYYTHLRSRMLFCSIRWHRSTFQRIWLALNKFENNYWMF